MDWISIESLQWKQLLYGINFTPNKMEGEEFHLQWEDVKVSTSYIKLYSFNSAIYKYIT